MTIDVNRGAERRIDRASGIEVWMYTDTPGVYYSSHGAELPEVLAASAGYPVDDYRREKLKRERVAAAVASIDKQLSSASSEEEVIDTRSGWKLVRAGDGRYSVLDDLGNRLNPAPLPSDIATNLFNQLAPAQKQDALPPTPPVAVAPGTKGGGPAAKAAT